VGHAHLLVEQVHQAVRLGREQLDDRRVVHEGDLLEGHALRLVQRLLLVGARVRARARARVRVRVRVRLRLRLGLGLGSGSGLGLEL